jgi:hypothetical protein
MTFDVLTRNTSFADRTVDRLEKHQTDLGFHDMQIVAMSCRFSYMTCGLRQ